MVKMPDIEAYADAIADCETGGVPEALRDTCIGDAGKAVGRYQLHEIFVRECNRILGRDVFTPADRTDPIKAREMTCLHAVRSWNKLRGMFRTHRNVARVHNGGPYGWRYRYTEGYAARFDVAFAARKRARAAGV